MNKFENVDVLASLQQIMQQNTAAFQNDFDMDNVSFTIEEENLICIYHKHDRRRTIAAISDALPDMDADMRPLAEQTIHKLHNMTDAAFEEAQFTMTLSDAE